MDIHFIALYYCPWEGFIVGPRFHHRVVLFFVACQGVSDVRVGVKNWVKFGIWFAFGALGPKKMGPYLGKNVVCT